MLGWAPRGDGYLVKRDTIKASRVPGSKGFFMIGAVAAQIAQGHVSWQQKQQPKQMGEELPLRFLGVVVARQYTLAQSHRFPLFSVVVANTTLEDEDLCGYLSAKTVRSIE